MNTFSTDRKLQPTWLGPYRIQEQLLNLYKLEELDGTPKPGKFSARHLQAFIPREGMELARAQKEIEERLVREKEAVEEGIMNTVVEEERERQLEGEESNIASCVAGRRERRQKEGGGWIR